MTFPHFVEQLLDPAAHPDAPGSVELRQTHISWLVLTDRWVYKIKKPLDLGFLDFSDINRRRTFCHEEVRLNQRLSPDVYRGVVVLRRAGDRVVVGDMEGDPTTPALDEVIDYAVQMRRLPEDQWLIRRLEDGTAGRQSIQRVARRIAAFHMSVVPPPTDSPVGRLETVRFNTEENFIQVRPFVNRTATRELFDVVRAYTRTFLDVREDLFRRREREGRILDGHGDLHAAQICLENGISFIDCIEFNERFRIADVAADVAFLAMDLDRHGRRDLRDDFVDTYMQETGDDQLGEILPFYMAYRAFTRGKVQSFLFDQLDGQSSDARKARGTAEAYFALAQTYAEPSPVLVITSGLMGSGKSSVAEALASRLGCPWIRTDGLRKELAGLAPQQAAREDWGEGIYSPEFTRRTYDEGHRRAAEALGQGQCAILDGSYGKAHWRNDARSAAGHAGVPFLALEVVTPEDELRRRLRMREIEGGVSDGRFDLLNDQKRRFEPLAEIPPAERLQLDGTSRADSVAYEALEAVYRRSLGAPAGPSDG